MSASPQASYDQPATPPAGGPRTGDDVWDYIPLTADLDRHVRKLRAIETALRSAAGPEGLHRSLREAETAERARASAATVAGFEMVHIAPMRLNMRLRCGELGYMRAAGRWFRLDSRRAGETDCCRRSVLAHNISMRLHGDSACYPVGIELTDPKAGLVYLTNERLIYRGRHGHSHGALHRNVYRRSFYKDALELRYLDEVRGDVVTDVIFMAEEDLTLLEALVESMGHLAA